MDKLSRVEKPARYCGGEWNSVVKRNAEVDFALAFADIYEVGMSHLGIQILYEVLNNSSYVYAQRVFCPWVDKMDDMKKNGEVLCSLEAQKPLHSFDVVGINLSYEMCYTNVLAMLELGKIPLHAQERGEDAPIVIGGGACTVNPEPLATFFDAFVIGEGEEVILEICALVQEKKKTGLSRGAFLQKLAQIAGVYVPSLYEVEYHSDGKVHRIVPKEGAPAVVQKRFIADFDKADTIRKPVVPFINTVHDRCVLEIMRGCSNGCRFCQAGYTMRPVRERNMGTVVEYAKEIIDGTGYDEISLSSLSSGDYSNISPLMETLIEEFKEKRVSVALPSLRVNTFDFAKQIQQVRKTGLTFAPEAGTQRLRDVINKNITTQDIMNSVKKAYMGGVSSVKLYFMIGLPTETYEDLDGMANLVSDIRNAYYEIPKDKRGGRLSITASASCFVPKAATPFQWIGQDTIEQLKEKQQYLREKMRIKGVKFHYHDAELSFLEAVFARGDRKLSCVIEQAYRMGAVFDAWQEHFSFERYVEAFAACNLDPAFYANREREMEEVFPFSHIDMMIDNAYLKREYKKANESMTTQGCAAVCAGCGLQNRGCEMHKKGNAQ